MKVHKAVITAAGPDQRYLPLQAVETRAGQPVTVLQLLLDELFAAGITQAAIIVAQGDTADYTTAAGPHIEKVTFIEQSEPLGYGHAVWLAKDFISAEPYLLMVSDHLYLSHSDRSCIRQVLDAASHNKCAISAVQATHESQLPLYGAVGGKRIVQSKDLFRIETVMEKPSPTVAEQHLIIPGLRAGQYLCFFGMHVLTASTVDTLEAQANSGDSFGLNETLAELAKSEKYLAYQVDGQRFNLEADHGLVVAQLALALSGPKRDTLMASIIELLATTR